MDCPQWLPESPVAGLCDDTIKGVQGGRYCMIGKDLAEIFAPVISEILALVKDQVSASSIAPSALLLVGGFGSSLYLREQLKAAIPAITVMQPPGAWLAVAKGALCKAMAEASASSVTFSIDSRITRNHFGLTVHVPFVKTVHKKKKATWAEKDGSYRITVVEWLIRKGQTIKETTPVTATFHSSQRCSLGPIKSQVVHFYSFDGNTIPKYIGNPGVKHLVSLTADLSTVPLHRFQIVTGADHVKYYELSFKIKIAFFSAHVDYSLSVQNKKYGSVSAEYI